MASGVVGSYTIVANAVTQGVSGQRSFFTDASGVIRGKVGGSVPLEEGRRAARLTALGYFFANGKASDVSVVLPFEADRSPVPKTDDPEAKWQCDVPKADGKENETKDIKDVGDFVKFCVVPAMKGR